MKLEAPPEAWTVAADDVPIWLKRPLGTERSILLAMWYGERGEPPLSRSRAFRAQPPMSVWGWLAFRRLAKHAPSPVIPVLIGFVLGVSSLPWLEVLLIPALMLGPALYLRICIHRVLNTDVADIRMTGYNLQYISGEINWLVSTRSRNRWVLPMFGSAGLAMWFSALVQGYLVLGVVWKLLLLAPVAWGGAAVVCRVYWQRYTAEARAQAAGTILTGITAASLAFLGLVYVVMADSANTPIRGSGPGGVSGLGMLFLFLVPFFAEQGRASTSTYSRIPPRKTPRPIMRNLVVGREDWPDV